MTPTHKIRPLIAILAFLLALPTTIFAQAPYSVKVDISSKDEALKAVLYSYVTRELRSLHDVSIVETDAQFTFHFIAIKSASATRQLGYSMSAVVLRRDRDQDMEFLKMTACKDAETSALRTLTNPMVQLEQYQLLEGGSFQEMQEQVSVLVAEFDHGALSDFRSADAIREKTKSLHR